MHVAALASNRDPGDRPGDPLLVRAGCAVSPARLDRLPLARAGLDRATLHRGDDGWLDAAWAHPTSTVIWVHDGRVLADRAETGVRLHVGVPGDVRGDGDRFLLGVDHDGAAVFAWHADRPFEPRDDGVEAVGLRELGLHVDDDAAASVVHAVALANWHRTHPHCSRCGAVTEVKEAGHVRRCPQDGSEHFPRTDPAVIMLITDRAGDRALLGRHVNWPATSYSTLAGFVEPGESLERAVVREVSEEAGVLVDLESVNYLGSQPWPFPSSLMLGFTAQTDEIDAARPDGEELGDVLVVTRADLEERVRSGSISTPPTISISRRLIEHWYGGPLSSGRAWT